MNLRWSEVELESGQLQLADSKTGAKPVYLNAPARQILAQLPRIEGNPYVIVGQRRGRSLVNLTDTWAIVRERARLGDLRLHDLRHNFLSAGATGGLSLPIIGALLGHSTPITTSRYAHLSAHPLHDAVESGGSP